jgi:hypothetical protein
MTENVQCDSWVGHSNYTVIQVSNVIWYEFPDCWYLISLLYLNSFCSPSEYMSFSHEFYHCSIILLSGNFFIMKVICVINHILKPSLISRNTVIEMYEVLARPSVLQNYNEPSLHLITYQPQLCYSEFWTPRGLVGRYQCFRETYCLHLHGWCGVYQPIRKLTTDRFLHRMQDKQFLCTKCIAGVD